MIEKDEAIQELKQFLVEAQVELNLGSCITESYIPVNRKKLNAIHIHVGDDKITKKSSGYKGYPMRRTGVVIFEIWMKRTEDPEVFFNKVRKIVFGRELSNASCGLYEMGSHGPFDGGIPGTHTMQLITELKYQDLGPFGQDI